MERQEAVKSKGFTLVELAVVLVIGATLLSAGLKILAVQSERAAINLTKKNQEAIKEALSGYLTRIGHLPCPDVDFDGRDTAADKDGANCLNASGAIPYADLGLTQDAVQDGWDNYLTYIPSADWTQPVISESKYISITAGAILLNTRSKAGGYATVTVNDPAAGSGLAVAILSHGKNGYGSINAANILNAFPAGLIAGDEEENSNDDPTIVKREYTDEIIDPHGAFDDIVMTISPEDLYTSLTAAGFQLLTPSKSIENINEYVIGEILKTKAVCTAGSGSCYVLPVIGMPAEYASGFSGAEICPSCGFLYDATAYTITVDGAIPRTYTFRQLYQVLMYAGGFA